MQDVQFSVDITLKPEVLEKEVTVTNQDEYTQCADVMKMCKQKIKEVDDERKTFTAPLDEAKKRIMAKAKEITEPLENYISKLEKAMGVWYLEEAIAKAQAEQSTSPDIIVPVVESVKTTKGQVSTTTGTTYNDFELVDLNLVPREYLMLDESKVKEAINRGGVKEISGIKIEEKVRFTSR
mgnify:CR=1 FL=1